MATDTSEPALALAKSNARRHGGAERIEFRLGNLDEPLGPERVQYLLSNPPYISDAEWAEVPAGVRDYEPHTALRAGADGLKYIRPLIERAHRHLARPGQLVVEIAASQKQAVNRLAEQADGLTNAHVLADHERLPRVLVADTQ